jgi:serine protease Do
MQLDKYNKKLQILLSTIALICSISVNFNAVAEDGEDKKRFTHFTSGTGFFVNRHHIVTNDHVVQNCKYIKVRGAVAPDYATIVVRDKINDLALLKTSSPSKRVALLREEKLSVEIGEQVTVMGYPLEHGIKGDYIIKKGKITDTEDIYQGVKRLQFTDSVEKGNSGGPLLDENGSVIGVVVGKMSFYLADSDMTGENAKPVKTSSMAISLESLRQFLDENRIVHRTSRVQKLIADKWMERKAKEYIVNVHCIKE